MRTLNQNTLCRMEKYIKEYQAENGRSPSYRNVMHAKVGQKNFGIEDVVQQNIDINYFANALKSIDQNQSADIVKIDRPVNLDGFASDLFARLTAVKDSDEESGIKAIKENILRERIRY